MGIRPVFAGAAAGIVLAAGGIAALDAASPKAEAQSGGQFATKAEVKSANERASAAINIGKRVWNLLGAYVADPNELVGAKSGPIRQRRGVGGGIPAELVKDRAAGPPGPQGPGGVGTPGQVYYQAGLRSNLSLKPVGPTTVATLDVPAGSYLANAYVSFSATGPTPAEAFCGINLGPPSPSAPGSPGTGTFIGVGETGFIADQYAFTTNEPTTITIVCVNDSGDFQVDTTSLAATRVGSVDCSQFPGNINICPSPAVTSSEGSS